MTRKKEEEISKLNDLAFGVCMYKISRVFTERKTSPNLHND
jgi:hypothetical protein